MRMGNRGGPGRPQVPSGPVPDGQKKALPLIYASKQDDDRKTLIQKAADAFRADVFTSIAASQRHYGLTDTEKCTKQVRQDKERRAKLVLPDDVTIFEGALSGKKKAALEDIASALHLQYNEKVHKKDLIAIIERHLEEYQHTLVKTRRFEGLYTSLDRGRRSVANINGSTAGARKLRCAMPAGV
ncbi:uncharacterized protein PHACADRAFT_199515 [Phanerochaete carnosa HHB-10118-sp]|uniref:Uncharacterized protein n=1 Tax=Phanerochaete carnosa (strain HHB-10118-sp) TaxID=650164 RepID=K5VKT9_PHACS|nr:uncharacterized protein PHACADRAFT_199515 [Phanerochaete carnosa HHB-10118-sp]EKM52013.1 hypothetical protein PHACADRAFT_199515 [Phanerochaete carnosa HHB-10118-sp]